MTRGDSGFDLVVIGAGIVGSFVAYVASEAGLRVLVVDRAGLCSGTSRTSSSHLSTVSADGGLLSAMLRQSLTMWREVITQLGNGCHFQDVETILAARSADEARAMRAYLSRLARSGISCSYASSPEPDLRHLLSPAIEAAAVVSGDAQVAAVDACLLLARAGRALGTKFELFADVRALTPGPDGVLVHLGDRTVHGTYLAVCAGIWSPDILSKLSTTVPITPRKGHVALLDGPPMPPRLHPMDFSYSISLAAGEVEKYSDMVRIAADIGQSSNSLVYCGSSREFAGLDQTIDAQIVRQIVVRCADLVPALSLARLVGAFVGFRPATPDGLPLIGTLPAAPNVIVASGHEGSGHGLAPLTAHLVLDLMQGRPSEFLPAVALDRPSLRPTA